MLMQGSAELRLDLAREPHYDYLEPKRLRLFRDDSGRLRLVIEGDRCYLDVKVVRAFPFSGPDGFVGLLDGRDKVIGLIEHPEKLLPDSREAARAALER
ncbi:MAG: DUF1854 domain-containing protein, partial [Candidatus Hydrogenedentes bacterium]|nr:DUF1854 domain-containing protein [Candidatus Hydrogenedentota bacterium]